MDLVNTSMVYRKVLEHRNNCKKWGKKFCLECFGGGLNKFVNDLNKENVIKDVLNECEIEYLL